MKPTRDDLWVEDHSVNDFELRKATDADLAAMGLVQAPECGECGGSGFGYQHVDYYDSPSEPCPECGPCPRCGGSGYGRLVSLDVDVEALRDYVDCGLPRRLERAIHQVLAALEGEDTDGSR